MSDTNVIKFPEQPESPAQIWDRAANFTKKSIVESLRNIGQTQLADEFETYPLCPYLLPGMEKLK